MAKKSNNIFKKLLCFLLLIVLSPVLIIEGIISAVKKHITKKKWKERELEGQKLLLSSSITDIDIMEGYMFEDYLKILLFYCGFKVKVTQKSRDYGADLILTDPKTKKTIIVQAKRYKKAVGSKAVQEIYAAKIHYSADEAWVITNSTFTQQAEQLAKENRIRLIDRQELIEIYTKVCKTLEISANDGQLLYTKITLREKYPYYI